MELITFNPFRSLGINNVKYVKPENMLDEQLKVISADWVLFPEYWQINTLVYGWKKKIFPSISTYHLGHDKIEMTRFFQALFPQHVPDTLILGNSGEARRKILNRFSFPFIAKKPRSSEGKGVYLIANKSELDQYLTENDILYIQEYLPLTRDLRVVFIGDRVFSAYWRIGQEGNFKNNLAQGGSISYENIPPEAVQLVENVCRTAGINYAGFDIAVVRNRLYLLEFNVMFGNQGLTGRMRDISQLIYRHLIEQHKYPGQELPL